MCGELYEMRTKPRGFTMVELLLAVAIGGLAALATTMVFSAQNRAATGHSRVVDSQQNARAAMDEMVREICARRAPTWTSSTSNRAWWTRRRTRSSSTATRAPDTAAIRRWSPTLTRAVVGRYGLQPRRLQ